MTISSCKPDGKDVTDTDKNNGRKTEIIDEPHVDKDTPEAENLDINDNPVIMNDEEIPSKWKELTTADDVQLDLRYATTDNFTKKQIYDCGRCYLVREAAEKLKEAQSELVEKYGYRFKIFDCFRPRPYQQRLWDILPDPNYVMNPAKGSMHSRGLAVDLTLVDSLGRELDLGTPFDFFGEEAHYAYDHPQEIKRLRWILKSTMEKYGFGGIRTEWWHFSYRKSSAGLDEWVWPCH